MDYGQKRLVIKGNSLNLYFTIMESSIMRDLNLK